MSDKINHQRIEAVAWDFQQCGILTSADSDQPVRPTFKLRNSKWCSVSILTFIEYSSDQQRLWPVCAYAQAGLSICWSHIPHCWQSYAAAQLYFCLEIYTTLLYVALWKNPLIWKGLKYYILNCPWKIYKSMFFLFHIWHTLLWG